jgi:2-methylisocitrate lyase-like PEP mutase family enzyme
MTETQLMPRSIRLKQLLDSGARLTVPGAYDALSARLAAAAGFEAVYMTGFGVSGSLLGQPDVGLLSATEMAERAAALAQAAAPSALIADGDNGHGGVLNVERMVRLYERGGAQCIQLEDQVFPKRCGHMASKEVIDRTEAVLKIRAAVDARDSSDFLIMARTDAGAMLGFDEALRRADAYLAAGADLLFVEAPRTVEQLQHVADRFAGARLVANMVEDGATPYLPASALHKMGYTIALYPVSALLSVAQTLRQCYDGLGERGRVEPGAARMTFQEYNRAVGLDQILPSAVSPVRAGE